MRTIAALIALVALAGMQSSVKGDARAGERPSPATLRAVTLTKDTLPLWSERYSKTVVVFINSYCCTSCNGPIGEMLSKLEIDTASCEIVLLLRGGTRALSRREIRSRATPYYPMAQRVLFDLQTKPDPAVSQRVREGAFGAFGIIHTPSLLIWDNQQRRAILQLDYKKLFEPKTMEIAGGVRKKISNALESKQ